MKNWKEAEIAFGYLLQQSRVDVVDFDALMVEQNSLSLSYQKGSLDTFSRSKSQSIGVRVIRDGKIGSSYTEDLSPESLKKCYFEALEIMQLASPVEYVKLSEPTTVPELGEIYNPALSEIDIERKMKLAQTLEMAALKLDPRITSVPYNGYGESERRVCYFNSKEFFGGYRSNECGAYLYPLAKEGDDAQMGKKSYHTRDFDSIKAEVLAKDAASEALGRLGAIVPNSKKSPVLLRNDVAQTYLGLFADMFSGQKVYDNTSPLKSKRGQALTPKFWSMTDDPFHHGAFGCRPIDSEGQISKLTPLLADGEIKNFLTDQRSAHLLGVPQTSSSSRSPYTSFGVSPSNVVVRSTMTLKREELLAKHPEVVVITSLKGLAGYNAINGDFSIESEGELYRGAERVSALKNFLVTGNLIESLAQIEAFGDDSLMDSRTVITPSVLISSLSIAGK